MYLPIHAVKYGKDDVRHERPIHLVGERGKDDEWRLLKHRARTYSEDSGEERHFVSVGKGIGRIGYRDVLLRRLIHISDRESENFTRRLLLSKG